MNIGIWVVGTSVFGQLPPEENYLPLKDGVWVKVRVSFRVLGSPDNCSQGRLPPVRVRVWVRVSFEVVG